MEYSVYTRSVEIHRDLEAVANFIGETPNLPHWTGFFIQVNEFIDGYYSVKTKMGPAQTRIESEPLNRNGSKSFFIRSQFGERRETARIELITTEGSTTVMFHMEVPINLPQEKVALMLNGLQSELCTLKNLLETATNQTHFSL